MTNASSSGFHRAVHRSRDTTLRRGVGLVALATVIAGIVFASNDAIHPTLPEATAPASATQAVPLRVVPANEFDPATLRSPQPAVGMPEHG